ncbi:MAG: hypothetical protein FIA99_14900 [Ruminiclostridium sp.]|nr:hypothetical protein [Ruminiclostridium sp.]
MTVHDFIVIYNETFKYIEEKYGADEVKDLWAAISREWCGHLRELAASKGLEGMYEYWGGNEGTLGREKAEYEVSLRDGILYGKMYVCPSVEELRQRGREIYHGRYSYCDHCLDLYGPIASEYGFDMSMDIDYDENGRCQGSCRWIIKPKH